ncbi:hypothetical protein FQZ97_885460 [compost metagenome]
MGGQVQLTHHTLGQGARLEQFELGVQVFATRSLEAVDLLNGNHLGSLFFDDQRGGGAVDGRDGERGKNCDHGDHHHQGQNAPLPVPDGAPDLEQVDLVADLFLTLSEQTALDDVRMTIHESDTLKKLRALRRQGGEPRGAAPITGLPGRWLAFRRSPGRS